MPALIVICIKEVIGQWIDCLSDQYRVQPDGPSKEQLVLLEKLHALTLLLPEQAQELGRKCHCEFPCHLAKELKMLYIACEVQIQRVLDKQELKDLPHPMHYYICKLQDILATVKHYLPKKSRSEGSRVQTNYYIQNSEVTIHQSPAAEAKEPAAAATSSAEATTPAGTVRETESQPSVRFLLPKEYAHCMEPQEKEDFYHVQKFIARERARGVKSDYNLDSYKQRIALALSARLHVIARRYTKINPGKDLAEIFGGNADDAKKYVKAWDSEDTTLPENYILKGKYPKLEQAYQAWLEEQLVV